MSVFGSTISPLLPQLHHASSFPILSRVPAELIHEITPHISAKDLASLASVDRECRALVRCVQFKDVSLIFDANEDKEKQNSELLDVMGGYIRRLRVLVASKEGTKGLDLQLVERICALPNLLILDMSVNETVSLDSLVGLMTSSIQHFRLHCRGLTVREGADGELPPSSLETFCLTLPSSPLLPLLFGSIAQSVHSVELNILPSSSQSDANELPFRSSFPRFPNLKRLSFMGPPSLHLLSVKSSAPYLTTLCVPLGFLSLLEEPLLPTLEVLSTSHDTSPPSDDELESLSDFLLTNDQLVAVEISLPLPAAWITKTFLPLLVSTPLAKSLRGLKLIWQTCSELEQFLDDTFSILRALALTSLMVGSVAQWRPNHDLILNNLTDDTKLSQGLQRLAFIHDSYLPVEERHPLAPPPQHHWQQSEMMISEYYLKPFPRGVNFESYLTPAELHSLLYSSYFSNCSSGQDYEHSDGTESPSLLKLYNLAWERYHQEKMKELAKHYRAALRGLSRFCAGKVCVWFNGDIVDGLDETLHA